MIGSGFVQVRSRRAKTKGANVQLSTWLRNIETCKNSRYITIF